MSLKTKPLNNNVLIEVLRDDDGVSRTDENESLKYGRLVDISVSSYHVTASAFGEFKPDYIELVKAKLTPGSIVRWEEFAEGGQTFEESVEVTNKDGFIETVTKTYALIPWWRLISYEDK